MSFQMQCLALAMCLSKVICMQAHACGGYPEVELQTLLTEQCSSTMQQRQAGGQELLASTQAVLNKQRSAWQAGCAAMGHVLLQLSQAHVEHSDGYQALKDGIKKALAVAKQVCWMRFC